MTSAPAGSPPSSSGATSRPSLRRPRPPRRWRTRSRPPRGSPRRPPRPPIRGRRSAAGAPAGRRARWSSYGKGNEDRAIRLTGNGLAGVTEGLWAVDGHAVRRGDEAHRWTLDGQPATAAVDGTLCWVGLGGETYALEAAARERSVDAVAGDEIVAPMPGIVLAVHAAADTSVRRGDLICVIEAMKMELQVSAPADGVVKRVLCAPGDQVRRGQRLAEFEPA